MSGIRAVVQESPFGQIVRLATGNRFFQYPEEKPGFQLPWEQAAVAEKEHELEASGATTPDITERNDSALDEKTEPKDIETGDIHNLHNNAALQTIPTHRSTAAQGVYATRTKTTTRTITREQTNTYTAERVAVEAQEAAERMESAVIMPTKTADGITLIDWYTTDDPENPQNWSLRKKTWLAFVIFWYTFVVYAASAIYTSSIPGVRERFGVGVSKGALGLSLYVIGYGVGPMFFSPLSELPLIGRNWPYIVSMILFVILAVPTALVDSYASLLVLRFITGVLGSPALATGGASMQDIFSFMKLPYGLSAWTAGAFCAPALGPLLSGFAVMNENWRWSFWIILWMSGPTALLMLFFMPETSAGNILLRRAQRLRKLTGNPMLKSQSEIDQGNKRFMAILLEQLIKPIEISIKDPAVMFTNIYTSYVYGLYYSFFEVFPLVYVGIYGFNLGELGLPFLCIIVGCIIGIAIYFSYLHFYLEPDIKKNGLRAQEHRLVPACVAVLFLPAGMFWFGWTAEHDLHWIVPTIGLTLFPIGAFVLFQCIFMYLPLSYPQYAASLFAANDLCRSSFAAGAILFAHPLFTNLGIGKGVSVLAGLLCGGIFGVWAIYWFGASLRARSKFALS